MYAFDRRWSSYYTPSTLHSSQDRVDYFTVAPETAIPTILRIVISRSQGPGSIWLLRLCAHGNAGSMELEEGLTVNTALRFKSLRGYFTQGGPGIEIHACGVASDVDLKPGKKGKYEVGRGGAIEDLGTGKGYSLLWTPANAAGVNVRGAVHRQDADSKFQWEGPTMVVEPTGSAQVGGA
jgi:hypothetical protein